ncbi:MAG: hypothetical protein IKY44_03480 [Clostridia bacterium]|nr:hypothetical protein [Clostridia bacterium]
MKEIFCSKGIDVCPSDVSVQDMELINALSRRKLSQEEVYTFNVVLCDNEIDRDMEQFSPAALEELAGMFVGKTGIFDHSMKSRDQTARIFKARTEVVEGSKNSLGEPYVRLVAGAYMPRTEKNAPIIAEIDAGILKEVSVGCSVSQITCSVCGADVRKSPCSHLKGVIYGGKSCYHVLSRPRDAYEWSFVAVPAQRNAGVSKSFKAFKKGGDYYMQNMFDILKAASEDVVLSKEEAKWIADEFRSASRMAEFGERYRQELSDRVKGLCSIALPDMDAKSFESMMKKLDIDELIALEKAFEHRASQTLPPTVQLAPKTKKTTPDNHTEFKI